MEKHKSTLENMSDTDKNIFNEYIREKKDEQ